ncbi:hypothetical protein C8239_10490 [Paracidovorax avenae]|uniref:DUF3299 domain-containing protein n=1 Tax=Paracidovorax avenae TaxID=80867 RepID=UPI000D209C03|nr:DUF3299 domain-containing protein [Paracidovorax avenae]AVS86705.1 hypothetical protein C8239_10490 [Paracidovorax avenae]AVT04402.1 hypothetical protein C8243_10255 [Paracidovorax avenae]
MKFPLSILACALACTGTLAAQGAAPGGVGAAGPALSSPLGAPPTGGLPGGPPGPGGLPAGSGPGYHSPQSPIKPLPRREDVVPWSTLTNLTKKTLKTRIAPVFNAEQKALDGKVQRLQGFMVPMDTRPLQRHFLLTSVPLTCAFCIPGGPESMVEVKASVGVPYSLEPIVVQGVFKTLGNDEYGLFYRMVNAEPVK